MKRFFIDAAVLTAFFGSLLLGIWGFREENFTPTLRLGLAHQTILLSMALVGAVIGVIGARVGRERWQREAKELIDAPVSLDGSAAIAALGLRYPIVFIVMFAMLAAGSLAAGAFGICTALERRHARDIETIACAVKSATQQGAQARLTMDCAGAEVELVVPRKVTQLVLTRKRGFLGTSFLSL